MATNTPFLKSDIPPDLTKEVIRLDGNAVGASTPIDGTGAGAVGNTYTVAAPFASVQLTFLRETELDDGTGNIANVEVNGVQYNAGPGSSPGYFSALPSFSSNNGENYSQPLTITANNAAFVEIWVIRRV